MFDKVEDAVKDLLAGKLIVVIDDEDRENEGDLIGLGSHVTPEMINFMVREARGLVCVPVSLAIAQKLQFKLARKEFVGENDTNFTDSIDHKTVTTGISAPERAETIKQILNTESVPSDFRRPGHIFPLIAKDGGVLVRAGHTEASVDLARLANNTEVGVICEIMNEDGTMSRLDDLIDFKNKHDLKLITIKDLIEYRLQSDALVKREVVVPMPTEYGEFSVYAYTNSIDSHVHIAYVMRPELISTGKPTLVRVHSECITGDVFHSRRCDCGDQLSSALRAIADEGCGVLLYMRQEGRGIGLINKLKAYNFQDQGYDTVEANEMLGFEADLRDYGIGAQILAEIGIGKIKLMTNNPRKIVGLDGYGLEVVERVPIVIDPKTENSKYLSTKKDKLGHLY